MVEVSFGQGGNAAFWKTVAFYCQTHFQSIALSFCCFQPIPKKLAILERLIIKQCQEESWLSRVLPSIFIFIVVYFLKNKHRPPHLFFFSTFFLNSFTLSFLNPENKIGQIGEKKKAKWTSGPLKARPLSDIFVPSIWHKCLVPDLEPEWDSEQINMWQKGRNGTASSRADIIMSEPLYFFAKVLSLISCLRSVLLMPQPLFQIYHHFFPFQFFPLTLKFSSRVCKTTESIGSLQGRDGVMNCQVQLSIWTWCSCIFQG